MASSGDQTRMERVARIFPFLKDLSSAKEIKSNKAVLLVLIQDLKDEGNQLFKEGNFCQACDRYKYAVFVANVLDERFYHEVESEFMATVYSNGSLGYLKLNKISEALDFSNKALQLQPDNVKAKYRKVQALFSLQRYKEALLEAQDGMEKHAIIFKDFVKKAAEALEEDKKTSSRSTSLSASVAEQIFPAQSQRTNISEEWLADTNALTTEKQKKCVLENMPKKKKEKTPQPVVQQSKMIASDSDVDSDSSNENEGDRFANNNTNVGRMGQTAGRVGLGNQRRNNAAHEMPIGHHSNVDVVDQQMGFTKVTRKGNRSIHMGLDNFSTGQGQTKAKNEVYWDNKPKGQGQNHLPPVNIHWPLEDSFQFRLACEMCFVKTGEGYKGYSLRPNAAHTCEKNFLVIRLITNQSLNWIKIRPFPYLRNSRFTEFKLCQQFQSSFPCKLGEKLCTFPHNFSEKKLWAMERDGKFSQRHFFDELHMNGIDNSEQLAARRGSQTKQPQQIPGLNYKKGSGQRLSSLAPLAEPASLRPINRQPPPQPSWVPTVVTPTAVNFVPLHAADYKATGQSLGGHPSSPSAPPQQQNRFQHAPPPVYKPGASVDPSSSSVNNSLQDYEHKIVCPTCFVFKDNPGKYCYIPSTHKCELNVLMVRQRKSPAAQWVRVRERTNHRDFPGKYVLCRGVVEGSKSLCRYGEARCSFAHNMAEQHIWGMEKNGRFSITDFILGSRRSGLSGGFTVAELLKKHGGYFTNVCRECFFGRPPRVSEAASSNRCSGPGQHAWDKSHVLAHISTTRGGVTIIDRRKFIHKEACYRICKFIHLCWDQLKNKCLSAHSMLERDVWMLERDTNISRQEIVQQSQSKSPSPQSQHQQSPPAPPSVWGGARPKSGSTYAQQAQTKGPTTQGATNTSLPSRTRVPHSVQEICGKCWTSGTRNRKDGTTNRCVKGHSNFNLTSVYLIVGIQKELHNLPFRTPQHLNFTLCRYTQQNKKCQFTGSTPCQFAHSKEEMEIWVWMKQNRVHKLEEVVHACSEDAERAKINQGESVVTVHAVVPSSACTNVPRRLHNFAHYCRYCSVQANSERQWEEHCVSQKHIFNVNSDKDHQWNFRQPPWGQGNNLDICSRHINGGGCSYSRVPDMFNYCKYAHSQEELDEWRERYEWRQMKRSLAKEQNMFSYMDNLLEEYNSADSQVTEMSETVTGVQVMCPQPLEAFRQEKNAVIVWTFHIQTKLTLEKVALLHHSTRLHFTLQSADGSKHQIAAGEQFEDVDKLGNPCYRVSVHFTGGMFGSFNQWVAFDFGKKPVLLRKVNVELGQTAEHEKVKDLRRRLAFDRWTKDNRQVIPSPPLHTEVEVELQREYKEPTSELVVTQDSIKELNQHNYIHKMRNMLHLEEITRRKLISSFNLVNVAEVLNEIVTDRHGTFHCHNGELFLKIPLSDNLTEDTGAGKLILTTVNSVLLTRTDLSDKHRVYEANIFHHGRGKDNIIVSLTPVCIKELNLKPAMKVEMEVQFQMDRLHFVKMHYALDHLESTEIVFPDITKINPSINEQHTLKVSSRNLNSDQMQSVRHIVAERTGYSPPVIMFGPFGTGKTETLAQATMVLLRERPTTKILICAQSNSAADLYVTKYLDPYLSSRNAKGESLLLRIVAVERRLQSVPPSIHKYCCIKADGTSFIIPSRDVVLQHRIVVTTVENALILTYMGLKGAFTHIFIDEAAQALECETIMPLTMATDKTCVVLTGDHLQISPKVYSPEARRQNFGKSLLERLHEYYFQFFQQLQNTGTSPLTIFLSINYRTKMEILRFISAVFYGGPDKLTAKGYVPSVVEITALKFYAVQGKEVQENDSTSFHNSSESAEVVERVKELLDDWPAEWGKVSPEHIGVVTPYFDQVKTIRHLFRRQNIPELKQVNVETVQNVQGKEYRALFISTVRTRNLLDSEHVAKALKEADSVGGVADFAFLSDCKLLNTAMTRTKSMVAVVGDPVALCAIGECIQIWRTYLKHCDMLNSIYPRSISYNVVKGQVVELLVSPMGKKLAEVTELCKHPNVPYVTQPKPSTARPVSTGNKEVYIDEDVVVPKQADNIPVHADAEDLLAEVRYEPELSTVSPLKPVSKVKVTKAMKVKDKVTGFSITADEILLQLASQSMGEINPGQLLMVECVCVAEEGGQAVLSYKPDLANPELRRKLQQASAAGKEFYCDEVIYQESDGQSDNVTYYYNFAAETLQMCLSEQPSHFKHCTIHISGERALARVIDPQDPVQELQIRGSLNRGRAFDKDEVVVEILTAEDEEMDETVLGRVVGIVQRAIDHRCRSIVCTANSGDAGLLIPINPGVPCIYNVLINKHVQRVKKGFMCVYQLSTDNRLTFSHYEKVEAHGREDKLFVVRYLKWLPGFPSPLGVVVGVMPAGHNLTAALSILAIEHHLPTQFSENVMQELHSSFGEDYTLSTDVYSTRHSLNSTWCFSIDYPHSTSIQVAFSIGQLSDTSYKVTVHVSDVAYFLAQDSELDREALQRGTTILPIKGESVSVLPSRLSSDLCSFRTGENRCALSVAMTVAGSGEEWHVEQTSVQQTVINCKYHFSYHYVEDILNDVQSAGHNYMNSCIIVLSQIAHMQRKQRKGNAHLDPQLSPLEMMAPRASHMVQELLIMANHHVAKTLLQAFPECTPLLQQPRPNSRKVEEWRLRHAADAINSVALTRPFLEDQQVCTCHRVCMCVYDYMQEKALKPVSHFDVVTELWSQAVEAAHVGQADLVEKVVATPNHHPQSSLALKELHDIVPPQQFVCSGDVDGPQQGHYSLNLALYTDMTRPLHSYICIVVQRLMIASMANQTCPYTQADIRRIVAACNHSQQRADSYTSAEATLHLAASLQSRPLTLFPVVEKVDKQKLQLHFPDFPHALLSGERSIAFTSLNPSAMPQMVPDRSGRQKVTVTWEERIYDAAPAEAVEMCGERGGAVELCADRFISHVPSFQWQTLLTAVREESAEQLLETVPTVQDHIRDSFCESQFVLDVFAAVLPGDLIQHFSKFSLSPHATTVMQVQVAAELTYGLLSPRLQLVSLSPTLEVCLEHHSSPSQCFIKLTCPSPTSTTFQDEGSFQQRWLPVLSLEAADTAVHSHSSAIIHNVFVQWSHKSVDDKSDDGSVVVGKFTLSQSFVKRHQIFLFGDSQSPEDLGVFNLEKSVSTPFDLVCVRYNGLQMAADESLDERVLAMVRMGSSSVCWVGHCVVLKVKRTKGGTVNIYLRLQSSTLEMPPELLDSSAASHLPCTMEWIPKTLLCRQMEHSMSCLTSASDLAKDVAVGRRPVNNINQSDVEFLVKKIDGHLNTDQKEGIETALKQPFTVIQGPPGSGKTQMASHLAWLYTERNRMTPKLVVEGLAHDFPQLLICASSDAAVDVIAGRLLKFGRTAPHMLRVYDKVSEGKDFPVPRDTIPPSKLKAARAVSPDLKKIALHHVIRSPLNSYCKQIQEFDTLFALYSQNITDDQVEEYRKLVYTAQLVELRQAEVILATCSVAATPRMADGTNIRQIIIDSCESCMEPESLLPVIFMPTAQQLVLLGDPRQLQPVVRSATAGSLGLSKSLVERYTDSALLVKEQYRMHQAISTLSSLCFYGDKLKVTTRAQQGPAELDVWPGSKAQPIAFCHVSGREETVTIVTETGLQECVNNVDEAECVAKIVEGLVTQIDSADRSVAVISLYTAQQHLIEQLLADRNMGHVSVLSVHQCQGTEFDYVVLSTCRSLSTSEMEKRPSRDWLQRHLGPTADSHLVNVAISRARNGLVVTGNKSLLQSDSMWKSLLEHFHQHKALVDVEQFIQALLL